MFKKIYIWFKEKFNKEKIELKFLIEIYDMIIEFSTGGEDGIINAEDVIILSEKLLKLISQHKKE